MNKPNELRQVIEEIVGVASCDSVHPGQDIYHPKGHPSTKVDAILDAFEAVLPPEHGGTTSDDNAQEVGEEIGWDGYRDVTLAILQAAKGSDNG